MTENQKRAKEYLDQYRQAKQDLKYLENRVLELRAKAESVKSVLGFEQGWTGEWTKSKGKRGKREKIMAPIAAGQSDPKSKENILFVLALQSMEYNQKAKASVSLCKEIEYTIDSLCNPDDALILKYRYISMMTYEQIAANIDYSYWHVKRLHWQALGKMGENMRR